MPTLLAEPLVRGLKIDERPWWEYLASFLCDAVDVAWATGRETAAAEAGLGFAPSVYWYVRRVHHAFNGVVLFHRVSRDALAEGERGGCPFDTGALWAARTVKTGMSDDAKRAFVAAHDRSIAAVLDDFCGWVETNHGGDCARYDRGAPPAVDIPQIVAAADGACWAPWAWELRIEKARVRRLLAPLGIVWTRQREQSFKDWVAERSGLDTITAQGLLDLVARIEVVCNANESAYDRAVRHIAETYGR